MQNARLTRPTNDGHPPSRCRRSQNPAGSARQEPAWTRVTTALCHFLYRGLQGGGDALVTLWFLVLPRLPAWVP